MPTKLTRSAGVLLHPSSLPGPFGIGDLGPEAYRWVETLVAAKQSWWQLLPLGPTGYGNSPYQSFSAFAGNVNLLSPELLAKDGLLPDNFLAGQSFPTDRVDYDSVAPAKAAMVREAWSRFGARWHPLREAFDTYREKEKHWLADFALFMAIREAFGGTALSTWSPDVRLRVPAALAELEKKLAGEVMIHTFGQFLFDRQWGELKAFANGRGVRIMGDAPIFVAGDSADVWAHPEQFLLNADGESSVVAGVPPDYFSEDGQLWGNPLYDWAAMSRDGYRWWAARLQRQFDQVDLIRLDHFRGFAAAWHIPAGASTAKNGEWVDGPRSRLFEKLRADLGELPIIAEDLGLITPDVHELRQACGFPGMRVLQFALGGPDNPYWPHNYEPNTVAYTGTHDNDTTLGWWTALGETDRKKLSDYIGHEVREPDWDLIRMAWASVALLAIAPLQDVLGLGREARMNVPGVAGGNWEWRFRPDQFRPGMIERLTEWTERYHRRPGTR
ncbi:MAG: 4-alpha-glucanotransferase [Fimbriiglobus sp.]|nr:4-alpha-glucanotransferase [Fimbriiglobus sp.]